MAYRLGEAAQRAQADFWPSQSGRAPLPMDWAGKLSLDDGCLMQIETADRLGEHGNPRTGWKVAATSAAVQAQLGVTEPGFGSLRRATTFRPGYVLPASTYVGPHVEVEICFEMGEGIVGATTPEQVAAAITRCFPAFELIEKRVTVLDFGFALADNAEHTAVVVGDPVDPAGIAFDQIGVRVTHNGVEVGTSIGAAALGHPVNSVVWLQQRLAFFGRSIAPGELVMTGSLMRQLPVAAGDRVEAVFDRIGSIALEVGA